MKLLIIISMSSVLILQLILAASGVNGGDLIDETCKRTPFYDVCRSTLRSDPQISSSGDVRALAASMAGTCLSQATDTLGHIKEMIDETSEPRVEQSLAYCYELYSPVVKYSLPQAIDALSTAHYAFAQDGLADAANQADACDKKFAAAPQQPLRQMNDALRTFAHISSSIIALLQNM